MKPKALTKAKIDQLIQGMVTYVRPVILQRGWMYYRSSQIVHVDYREADMVAKVLGKGLYEVRIVYSRFERSTCECPYDGYCKHMAAVFFAAYAYFELRPELFLQEHLRAHHRWVATRKKKDTAVESTPQGSESPRSIQETDDIEAWHDYFDNQFRSYFIATRNAFHYFYSEAHDRLLPLARSWHPAVQELYRLHLLFFMLRQAEQQHLKGKHSYASRHEMQGLNRLVIQCNEALADLLQRLDIHAAAQFAPKQTKQTIDWLRSTSQAGSNMPVDWAHVYCSIWRSWGDAASLIRHEKEMLARSLGGHRVRKRSQAQVVSFMAFFDVMEGQDEQARAKLESHRIHSVHFIFVLLEGFAAQKEWERLKSWLAWMKKDMEQSDQRAIERYGHYWGDVLEHLDCEEDWKSAMQALLPLSYSSYAPYLLKHGWYEDWIDLQIWLGGSLHSVEQKQLDSIERKRPELLLPLYHQTVEQLIAQKKREAYKEAVHMIQKLQYLYERLKQPQRWNGYIRHLIEHHARLHAFQEELRKGSLI